VSSAITSPSQSSPLSTAWQNGSITPAASAYRPTAMYARAIVSPSWVCSGWPCRAASATSSSAVATASAASPISYCV
jgi:hypothetical protein